MANAPTKTPSILLEAIKFAASVPPETPYDDLARTALDAGWAWYLRQSDTVFTPTGGLLVSFDVLLGNAENALAPVDTISVQIASNTGPVTGEARMQATMSLIYLFFGRLPPVKEAVKEENETDRARKVPIYQKTERGYEEYDEPIGSREEDAANRAHNEPSIVVVDRQTPDGLPIFVDLFSLGARGPDIAAEVLNVIEKTLQSINTVPMLMALMSNNPDLIPFFQDLADVPQRQELKAMLDDRKAAIEAMPVPRRRQVA